MDEDKMINYEKMKNCDYGIFKPSRKKQKMHRKLVKNMENDSEFIEQYKIYTKFKKTITRKKELIYDIQNNEVFVKNQIKNIKKYLLEKEYVKLDNKDNLQVTIKGVLASGINECNELLLAELITNNYLDNLDFKQLGTILSIFSNTRKVKNKEPLDNSIRYDCYIDTIVKFVCNIRNELEKREGYYRLYLNTNWEISTDIMDASYEWLDGGNFNNISKRMGIYEGNLIRDFI